MILLKLLQRTASSPHQVWCDVSTRADVAPPNSVRSSGLSTVSGMQTQECVRDLTQKALVHTERRNLRL